LGSAAGGVSAETIGGHHSRKKTAAGTRNRGRQGFGADLRHIGTSRSRDATLSLTWNLESSGCFAPTTTAPSANPPGRSAGLAHLCPSNRRGLPAASQNPRRKLGPHPAPVAEKTGTVALRSRGPSRLDTPGRDHCCERPKKGEGWDNKGKHGEMGELVFIGFDVHRGGCTARRSV